MKKIMIMIAAATIAVVSQAASFNWSVAAATKYEGYSVYLANNSTYTTIGALQADLLGENGNNGVLAKASASARSAGASGAISGLEANKSYEYYYVFVDANNNYWVSDVQTVVTKGESDTPPSMGIAQAAGSAILSSTAKGTLTNVPEPTSGLLLLLGVAGLALRRKQK